MFWGIACTLIIALFILAFLMVIRFIEDTGERALYNLLISVLMFCSLGVLKSYMPPNEVDILKESGRNEVNLKMLESNLVRCSYRVRGESNSITTTRNHCSYLLELSVFDNGGMKELIPYRENNNNGGKDELATSDNDGK